MNNNIEVIGIDHGWSQMKTSNTCFNTSIKELANAPAFHDNVLEYDDRYFAVGEERLEVLDSKVENENFYLLTLVAIAKELEIRGKSEADVVLAVGLPLTRFSAERKPFIDYLSKNRDVVFGFEQKLYTIHILNVLVYPMQLRISLQLICRKTLTETEQSIILRVSLWQHLLPEMMEKQFLRIFH